MFDLTGKVAIITGGGGVLGSALAKGLANAGAKIGILGRTASKLINTCNEIKKLNGEAIPLQADVLDKAQLQLVCDAVISRWKYERCYHHARSKFL